MRFLILIGLILITSKVTSQKVLNIRHYSAQESIEINEGLSINRIQAGYTLWLPRRTSAKGLIVVQEERRDSLVQNQLIRNAIRAELGVVYICTENPLEFYFKERNLRRVADDLIRIVNNFNIPKGSLLYIGSGIAGTRALKLGAFAEQNTDYNDLRPLGIVLYDTPIDIHRYYNASKSKTRFQTSQGLEIEFDAQAYIRQNLGGTPLNSKAQYASYSPYSKYVRNGGNAAYFTSTNVRAYISNNVNYENETLGGNSFDLYNFVKQLERLGNDRAEIILFSPRSKPSKMSMQFSEKEVISWFLNLLKT